MAGIQLFFMKQQQDTTLFWRRVVKRRTARWLHGLVGAFISGGTTVGTTQGGIGIAQAFGVNIEMLSATQIVTVFFTSGVAGAVLYLRQSPLPSIQRKWMAEDEEDSGKPRRPHVPGDPMQFIHKPPEEKQ